MEEVDFECIFCAKQKKKNELLPLMVLDRDTGEECLFILCVGDKYCTPLVCQNCLKAIHSLRGVEQ